ncbi:hypothetical protein KP509_22G070500 [Ceratopteris richardii]|uniref:Uncharacterized protein n=1 Tax=Ceratopteris richardii TaxID=49495 RepID=A0A8T2S682_CERRI|nr:hypothetical protein KP509_22G070500 [Ceratopteris richardii]
MGTVGKKPGLFTDIGKKAKDLLQKGFSTGHMLFFSHVTSTGMCLSTNSIMSEGLVVGTVSSSFKGGGVSSNISFSTLNQVTSETTYEDLIPGLKISLSATVPDAKNLGNAEIVYQHDWVAFTALSKGLKVKPVIECTANFGSPRLCVGGSLSYDSANNAVTSTIGGIGYTAAPISLGLLCNMKEHGSLSLYCLHEFTSNTSWALNLDLSRDKKISDMTIGAWHKLNSQTSIKAKVNKEGILSALLEHELKPLVSVGLCVGLRCLPSDKEKPSIGLAVTVLSA